MKTLCTLFFLFAGGFFFVSDAQIRLESSDFDKMYKENMIEYTYMRGLKINGEYLSRKERRSVMMRHPAAAKYFRQSRNLDIASNVLATGSLVSWVGSIQMQRRLGDQYDMNKDGWMIACTTLSIGFIALDIISQYHLRKAVNAYNKETLRELW